jgi:Holliday junction resolvase RusA-like endonuclease|nr:MAG TPA: Endodeoxyribonuclease RusA [Caudoviricetes sp.]
MLEKKTYEIEIDESITGKQRPRMNIYTGKAYTPTKTKNYEYLVKQIFINKYPNFTPIEGRVAMTIIAYFEIPKSTSKKKTAEMICDEISPTKKPDWDNIGKIVSDALNKFAYKDDSQITDVRIFKKYSTIPKVIVKILEY